MKLVIDFIKFDLNFTNNTSNEMRLKDEKGRNFLSTKKVKIV